jgi:hypothetical protein
MRPRRSWPSWRVGLIAYYSHFQPFIKIIIRIFYVFYDEIIVVLLYFGLFMFIYVICIRIRTDTLICALK